MSIYILSIFLLILLTTGILYTLKYNCIIVFITMLLPISLTFWGIFTFKRNLKELLKVFLKEEVWRILKKRNGLLLFISLLVSFHIIISYIKLYSIYSSSIKTFSFVLLSLAISFLIGSYFGKYFGKKFIKPNFKETLEPILGIIISFIPLFGISLVATTLNFLNNSAKFDIIEISNKAYTLIKSDCIFVRFLSRIFFFIDSSILSLINTFDSIFFKIFVGLLYFFYASLMEFIPLYYLLFGLILLTKLQKFRR